LFFRTASLHVNLAIGSQSRFLAKRKRRRF
jgi:hypothetical protein